MSKQVKSRGVTAAQAQRWLTSDSGKALVDRAIKTSQERNEKDKQSLKLEVRDLYVPVTI